MAADVFPDNAFARVGPHGGSDAHTPVSAERTTAFNISFVQARS